jgi:hypothetical protein
VRVLSVLLRWGMSLSPPVIGQKLRRRELLADYGGLPRAVASGSGMLAQVTGAGQKHHLP